QKPLMTRNRLTPVEPLRAKKSSGANGSCAVLKTRMWNRTTHSAAAALRPSTPARRLPALLDVPVEAGFDTAGDAVEGAVELTGMVALTAAVYFAMAGARMGEAPMD